MVNVAMILLSVLMPLLVLLLRKERATPREAIRLFLLYAFIFDVGFVGIVFGFIPHVFFPDEVAQLIGVPPGGLFQFEVGLNDGAWGLLGFLCVFIGGGFWLATGLGWSFFMLGAAAGHIVETLKSDDYAPYNFLPMFTDAIIGVWLLVLLYAYWRLGGFSDSLRRP